MVGSKCDLKMHVRNLGYPSPTNWGPKRHLFSTISQLKGNFNGLYLWNETRYIQSVKCVDNTQGVCYTVPKCHELYLTNGFKLDPNFYPLCVNSAFYFIAKLRRRTPVNGTLLHFAKQWTINRANNTP